MTDSLVWQGDLFAAGRPEPDPGFAGSRRHDLGEGAWIDEVPGWLAGADELFADLLAHLPWEGREMPMYGQTVTQPRLGAWNLAHPVIDRCADLIGDRYGVAFGSVGANLYRDGRDSVAPHGDRHARGPGSPDVVVAVLSLGASRRFLVRPRGGGRATPFRPAGGDLLVMGGSCQRRFQHGVPKVARAGPRISVTFR